MLKSTVRILYYFVEEIERKLNSKKSQVNQILNDIEATKQQVYSQHKEAKQKVREFELAILESEKQI